MAPADVLQGAGRCPRSQRTRANGPAAAAAAAAAASADEPSALATGMRVLSTRHTGLLGYVRALHPTDGTCDIQCDDNDWELGVPTGQVTRTDAQDVCRVCLLRGTSGTSNPTAVCCKCGRASHLSCLRPRLEKVPEDPWQCASCFGATTAGAYPTHSHAARVGQPTHPHGSAPFST